MSHYKRYPAYKDSGVEWIGIIPDHWMTMQFKHVASICNGQDYKNVEKNDGPYLVIGSGGEFARASTFIFDGESVLLGRKGTIDKPLYINGPFWVVDTMFFTRIADNSFPKFVYYCALTIPFGLYSTNTALPSMTGEDLSSHVIAAPELEEQRLIAKALDRETARIDALIAKKTRFIELLKEKRQALITQAVTKGLDPNVRMKDSGVDWIREIPHHWKTGVLKRFWIVIDCKHVTAEFIEHGIPLASIREVQSNYVDLSNSRKTTDNFYSLLTEGGRTPLAGDIIYSRNVTVGEAAMVCANHDRFAMGQDVCLLRRIGENQETKFMHYQLRSPLIKEQLELLMVGATFRRVNVDEIRI